MFRAIRFLFLGEPEPRSWVVVPLLAGSYVLGFLYVDCAEHRMTPERQDLAVAVADNLGQSLKSLLNKYGRLQ